MVPQPHLPAGGPGIGPRVHEKPVSIRVYRYGLLPPIEGASVVRDQMLAAHRYRNTLVEIERARRDAVRLALSSYGNLQALEQAALAAKEELDAALADISQVRGSSHKRSEPEAMRERARLARDSMRAATEAFRDYRRLISSDESIQTEMARINELASGLRRGARALCGVYW